MIFLGNYEKIRCFQLKLNLKYLWKVHSLILELVLMVIDGSPYVAPGLPPKLTFLTFDTIRGQNITFTVSDTESPILCQCCWNKRCFPITLRTWIVLFIYQLCLSFIVKRSVLRIYMFISMVAVETHLKILRLIKPIEVPLDLGLD